MSNERIDLTQFDNITSYPDGGWEVPEEDNLSKTLVADLDGSLVCSTSVMAQIEGYSLEEAQRFARIIAQLPNIVAELKRIHARDRGILDEFQKMSARIDRLLNALRIIRDDLNDALEVYPTINKEDIEKVRNFANDASQ